MVRLDSYKTGENVQLVIGAGCLFVVALGLFVVLVDGFIHLSWGAVDDMVGVPSMKTGLDDSEKAFLAFSDNVLKERQFSGYNIPKHLVEDKETARLSDSVIMMLKLWQEGWTLGRDSLLLEKKEVKDSVQVVGWDSVMVAERDSVGVEDSIARVAKQEVGDSGAEKPDDKVNKPEKADSGKGKAEKTVVKGETTGGGGGEKKKVAAQAQKKVVEDTLVNKFKAINKAMVEKRYEDAEVLLRKMPKDDKMAVFLMARVKMEYYKQEKIGGQEVLAWWQRVKKMNKVDSEYYNVADSMMGLFGY